MITLALIAAVAALAIAFVLTPLLRDWARRRGLLDIPNDASSHDVPTPRNGGFAIVPGIIVGTIAAGGWRHADARVLAGVAVLVGAFAAIDEFRPVPQKLRLLGQIILSAFTLFLVRDLAPAWLGTLAVPLAIIWLVGSINGFNFMDGLNGLSSTAAIVSGCTIAVLGALHGDATAVIIGAALAGAAAGFLPWNLPSGSVFMGDVGSATLGFLIGLSALHLHRIGVPFLAAALPLLSFVSDAFLAVIRRAATGQRFFSTRHRTHFYQRLNQQGWSHAAVTGLWGVLMSLAGVAAIAYDRLRPSPLAIVLVAAVALLHATVFVTVAIRQRRRPPTV